MNLKTVVRWLVRILTVGFLVRALVTHWHDVTALTLRSYGIAYLVGAATVTLGAHVWAGVVWSWLLSAAGHPQPTRWATVTYLRTNIAKYLPGNVWHFFRRVRACQERQIPLGAALLSVVLEAVLMVAAACLLASTGFPLSGWHLIPIVPLLVIIHPRWLNPVLAKMALGKAQTFGRLSQRGAESKSAEDATPPPPTTLSHYPLGPLVGEFGFVLLRGAGFVGCVLALYQPGLGEMPLIVAAFAVAYVAGLVVPGAPGGIGVFEATALGLLQNQLPSGVIFGAVAIYRLVSTGAEALGGLVPQRWAD